jgi:hypothetical protein
MLLSDWEKVPEVAVRMSKLAGQALSSSIGESWRCMFHCIQVQETDPSFVPHSGSIKLMAQSLKSESVLQMKRGPLQFLVREAKASTSLEMK